MAKKILIPLLLLCFAYGYGQETKTSFQDCYLLLQSDTITIGNKLIERQWIWKEGKLLPLTMTKKSGTENHAFRHTTEDIKKILPEGTIAALSTEETSRVIAPSNVSTGKLLCELIAHYPGYDKKTMITIAPGIPAVKMSYAFKNTGKEGVPPETASEALDQFFLPSLHYNVRTIEFFDQTDGHNNLVEEDHFMPFRSQIQKRGNLLFAESNTGQPDFFILKEAPCSFVQLHYPGYDFIVQGTKYEVAGTGVSSDDLVEGEWINTYASVTGVPVNDQPVEFSLRMYQKSIRKHVSSRDDMIMLNTWGDRNRDQSVNEEFCMREIDACKKYGFTHFQIDDGWQAGLSSNSGSSAGKLWDEWEAEHWQPNPERFPNGFQKIVDYADENGINLGLWFHPSNTNSYEKWERDAMIVVNLYRNYGIRYFKIDGIKLPDKRSEVNFRKFLDLANKLSQGNIVFNLDATANRRGGYHFLNAYGNIFLENRYTDWRNYFPHWTLRNLWQLSEYVPPENLQVEFLNTWRNADRYAADDPLAPSKIPFEYAFAITMAAQPLAWFEASNLPPEAEKIIPVVANYKEAWHRFHEGYIFPIGEEPNGVSWTGFQSVRGNEGYIIIYRELNPEKTQMIKTFLPSGKQVSFELVAGDGKDFDAIANNDGAVEFGMESALSFAMYRYKVK